MADSSGVQTIGGVATGYTALAGGATPSAAANTLAAGINVVATVATAGDSMILPANIPKGGEVIVVNTSAAKLDVNPNTGATINAVATTQVGIATKTGATFVQVGTDGLTWVADNTVAAAA